MAEKKEEEKALGSMMIGMCVIQNSKGQFLATHEIDGWYFPAGRVDLGETFETGAKREALEEGGVSVDFEGIILVQHSAFGYSRFRVIYKAKQTDEKEKPRGIDKKDHEIIEAQYLSIKELKTKELRSNEVVSLFKIVEEGTKIFDLSFIKGFDGEETNHSKVQSKLVHYSKIILGNQDDEKILMVRVNDKVKLPSKHMTEMKSFDKNLDVFHKNVKSKFELTGIAQMFHLAPKKLTDNGYISVTFVGEFDKKVKPQFDKEIAKFSEFFWISPTKLNKEDFIDTNEFDVIQQVKTQKKIFPLNLIQKESGEYKKLVRKKKKFVLIVNRIVNIQ